MWAAAAAPVPATDPAPCSCPAHWSMVYEMPITQQTLKEAVQTTLLSAPLPLPHTHTKQTPPLDLPSRRFNICSIKQPPLPPPSFSPSSTMNRIIKQQTKNKNKKK